MENPERSHEKHSHSEENLEKMRSIIARAPQLIEEEMNRGTDNPWFACMNSQLQSLMYLVDFAREDNEIDTEKADVLIAKIRDISRETMEYMKQYPHKEDEVPQELKEYMYKKLDIFAS